MKNEYEVFWKADVAFEKVFSDLKKATKSIHIETFRFETDKTGTELIKILIQKAKKIPVKIIVDGYGLQDIKKDIKKQIEQSKIEFIIFNPIWQNIKKLRIRKWFRSLPYRNHRKLTIIDGKIAYVGGMNYHDNELQWHDLFTRIKGPIVEKLKSHAFEMTKIATRHSKEIQNIPKQNTISKKLIRKNKQISKLFEKRKIIKQNTRIFTKEDCITRQIPLSKQRPLKKQLKRILKNAKKEVWLTTPYFIPDPQFQNMLHSAVKRGIKVRLIVPKKSDTTIADILTQVNLFIAHKMGVEIRLLPKMTHAKYIIADNNICSYGSANMDYQAFYNNYELNITSDNVKLVKELKKQFSLNWNKAIPHTITNWNKRPRMRKLMEKILHPFRKYF